MAVMTREAWTDQRLDDLNHRVDSGFNGMSREFQAIRLEMRTEFAAVRSEMATEFSAVRSEMASMRTDMNSQFAAQNRMVIQLFGGLFGTMVVGFLGVIATVIAQS